MSLLVATLSALSASAINVCSAMVEGKGKSQQPESIAFAGEGVGHGFANRGQVH
jgi:hypothetical protein